MSRTEIQTKVLRRKESDEEALVYRAGLEWDLVDPIVIEGQKDLKSEQRWRGRLTPFSHQVQNLITYCRRLPVTLLADDVGLGKTISAGLIISELQSRDRINKTLVVCPKLLGPQWQEELKEKFDIPSIIAVGRELQRADPGDGGAVITTYQSARLYLDQLPSDRFQMLVLDEAHKLRNLYGVENPPQVATLFRKVLEERRFRFVLMLTATPIHNRLWDLYSLVDLLTVARGHKNPFGSEGMFARRFIADSRESARHLKPEARDEFRSIVYGYMSRTRRGDAKLYFPGRVIQLHRTTPTDAELELVKLVASSIEKMNRLAQISILQALASSPDALRVQLDHMAKNGTVPGDLAISVRRVVASMPPSAKLLSLGKLLDELMQQSPERWRAVIFTTRLETQTTIQNFLERRGLKVGIINGNSGPRNQKTIAAFRGNPPAHHIVVSTEAGSEGVNLQVANVLVNFDLPWNPMIVEQRIGRVQRLASEHANVSIYNVVLKGTFEEYIVGRLMEKLQMAAHAIGDVESLLEATGTDDDDDSGAASFEEKIRELVVAALTGKDVEEATRRTEASIAQATETLQSEREAIDQMLGSGEGSEYVGPRAPKLLRVEPSLSAKDFSLRALALLGAQLTQEGPDLYCAERDGGKEYIRFSKAAPLARESTWFAPSTAAFQRLVDKVVVTGIHAVEDRDQDSGQVAVSLARKWVESFGGRLLSLKASHIWRCFEGDAVVRVRATVAHDSYERLVIVPCNTSRHRIKVDKTGLGPLKPVTDDAREFGVDSDALVEAAERDPSVADFVRFYLERRDQEARAAAGDERRRRKLEDEFTPRLELTLVSLEGRTHRVLQILVEYQLDESSSYSGALTIVPHAREITDSPEIASCSKSGRRVPANCLQECEITHQKVLRHLLIRSESSGRAALPEKTVRCSVSGKVLLADEVELSSVTGKPVDTNLLRTSGISGRRAENSYFGRCEFTGVEALTSELAVSEVSGRRYRADEQQQSAVSAKCGHKSEFVICAQTGKALLPTEGEVCAVTGNRVMPGMLETCEESGKRVMPSQIERCAVTGKRVLKSLLVSSSVSGARVLERAAVRSVTGAYCLPGEGQRCVWSGRQCHPDDAEVCRLTGLIIHREFASVGPSPTLRPLADLLNAESYATDEQVLWGEIAARLPPSVAKGKARVSAAALSPTHKHVAVVIEVRALFGLRVSWAGLVYSISEGQIAGRVVVGRRTKSGWVRYAS